MRASAKELLALGINLEKLRIARPTCSGSSSRLAVSRKRFGALFSSSYSSNPSSRRL
jgi:hypothetical protein